MYFNYMYMCYTLLVGLFYRKARRTIDTTETKREFGPVVIHYGKVKLPSSLPLLPSLPSSFHLFIPLSLFTLILFLSILTPLPPSLSPLL